jgi:hypothetical protein
MSDAFEDWRYCFETDVHGCNANANTLANTLAADLANHEQNKNFDANERLLDASFLTNS